MIEAKEIDVEKFEAKYTKGAADECWEWTAGFFNGGYGAFGVSKKAHGSHRVSWVIANGPIPEGLQINHHCDNRKCVNPDHLYAGTNDDNLRDKISRDRSGKKIKIADVPDIFFFKEKGLSQNEIAAIYDVNQSLISRILSGESWAHAQPKGEPDERTED